MLIAAILSLSVLTALNLRAGRSVVFPPALFSGLWMMLLCGVFACGDTFYPLSATTLLVYLTGAASFSVGGVLALRRTASRRSPEGSKPLASRRSVRRILDWGLLFLSLMFPWYWKYVESLSASSGLNNFWKGIRIQSILQSETTYGLLGMNVEAMFFGNLVTLSIILALIAYYEARKSRNGMLRAVLYLSVSLAYVLLTAANVGAATLLISALGIECLLFRRLRILLLVVYLSLFLGVFWLVGLVLEKGQVRSSYALEDNLPALVNLVQLYGLGGLVAFDRIVQDPQGIRPTWSIWRFFFLTANKLGAAIDVPSLHAEYTMISPAMAANVYTLYFSYFPEYGWLGVIGIMCFLGTVLTRLYTEAMRGSPAATVLYGITFTGIVLSGFNEQFFTGLSMLLKTTVLTLLIYKGAGILGKGKERSVVPLAASGGLYRRA